MGGCLCVVIETVWATLPSALLSSAQAREISARSAASLRAARAAGVAAAARARRCAKVTSRADGAGARRTIGAGAGADASAAAGGATVAGRDSSSRTANSVNSGVARRVLHSDLPVFAPVHRRSVSQPVVHGGQYLFRILVWPLLNGCRPGARRDGYQSVEIGEIRRCRWNSTPNDGAWGIGARAIVPVSASCGGPSAPSEGVALPDP